MGRKIRPGISVDAQLDEGYAALGFAKTMVREINTDEYLSSVIDLAHSVLDREFGSFVDAVAVTNPARYRHVYEPGNIGVAGARLWTPMLYGRGRNKEASFEWRPSVLPILTPQERKRKSKLNSGDAMRYVPDEIIEKLSKRRYVFKMVAPIMEYGLRVNIQPVYSKFLFIPTAKQTFHRNRKEGTSAPRHYRFAKYNVPEWGYRNPQEPSGTQNTVGQFTGTWVSFWNGGHAENIWDTEIAPRIQMGLTNIDRELASATKMARKRRTQVSITTFKSKKKAMESGANLARAFIKGKARSYRQASKHVDRHGYFGGEREY